MKKSTPASPKFARCCHPQSSVASEFAAPVEVSPAPDPALGAAGLFVAESWVMA
jgi:hypothetical protein